MENTAQALKVTYEENMSVQQGDQWNNAIVLTLDCTDAPYVGMESNFGSSYTFQSYHNLQFTLVDVPNQTTPAGVQQIIDSIKESEEVLIAIYEGFESYWDGSNTKGKLTEEAHELLEGLQQSLANEFENGLPCYWSADDYFQSISSYEIGKNWINSDHNSIQTFWESEYENSDFVVEEEDAIRYLWNELQTFVAEDLEEFVNDRMCDETPLPLGMIEQIAKLKEVLK